MFSLVHSWAKLGLGGLGLGEGAPCVPVDLVVPGNTFLHDEQQVIVSVSTVDHQRLLHGHGQPELPLKHLEEPTLTPPSQHPSQSKTSLDQKWTYRNLASIHCLTNNNTLDQV